MNITYLSECDTDYAKKLATIKTRSELVRLLEEYAPIAWDALDLVKAMIGKRFDKLIKDMAKERKGIFSENMDAAIVMMPETMFKVSIVASEFKAPWGMAFNRLIQVGKIIEEKGRFKFIENIKQEAE